MSERDVLNVILCGVGGQGSVIAAEILGMAAVGAGLQVRVGETFGAAQRGGSVMSHVRIGQSVFAPLIPAHSCDLMLGLEPVEALRVGVDYLRDDALVIVSTEPSWPVGVRTGATEYPATEEILRYLTRLTAGKVVAFNAQELAAQAGNLQASNVVMLGALLATGAMAIGFDDLATAIERRIGNRLLDANLEALRLGYDEYVRSAGSGLGEGGSVAERVDTLSSEMGHGAR